jgi:Zn-finger nucleic acid-binding protein
MHCPKCGMKMHEMKMRGVDVEVCFSCNGIFLDQGELETLQKMPLETRRGIVDAVLNWFRPETKP